MIRQILFVIPRSPSRSDFSLAPERVASTFRDV